jgi:hypothetical protein
MCCSPDAASAPYDTNLCVGLQSQYDLQCGASPQGDYMPTGRDDYGCCRVISAMHTNKCLCFDEIQTRLTSSKNTRTLDMNTAAQFCAAQGVLDISSKWDTTLNTTFTECSGVDTTLLEQRMAAFTSLKELFDSNSATTIQNSTLFTTGAVLDWPALGTFSGSTNVLEVLSIWDDSTSVVGSASNMFDVDSSEAVQPAVEHVVGDEFYWSGVYEAAVLGGAIDNHDAQMIVQFESGTAMIERLTLDFAPMFAYRMQELISMYGGVAVACNAVGTETDCDDEIFQSGGSWSNSSCESTLGLGSTTLKGLSSSLACANSGQTLQGESLGCAGVYGAIAYYTNSPSTMCAPITLDASNSDNNYCKDSVCPSLPTGPEICIPLFASFGRKCGNNGGNGPEGDLCCNIISMIMSNNCMCHVTDTDSSYIISTWGSITDFDGGASSTSTTCDSSNFPFNTSLFNATNDVSYTDSNDCSAETTVDTVFQSRVTSLVAILTSLMGTSGALQNGTDSTVTLAIPGVIPSPMAIDEDLADEIISELMELAYNSNSYADDIMEFDAVSDTIWQLKMSRYLSTIGFDMGSQFGLTLEFASSTATTVSGLTITFTPSDLSRMAAELVSNDDDVCSEIDSLDSECDLSGVYSDYSGPDFTSECAKDLETKPWVDPVCQVNHKPFMGDSKVCRIFWSIVEEDDDDGDLCGHVTPGGVCETTVCDTLTTVELH